jgi:ABC-2 type transport system permease protein
MHLWNIAIKEIRLDVRDPRTLIFMLLFPIVLMLILGTALSGAFSGNVKVGELSLLYKSELGEPLAIYWDEFVQGLEREGVRVAEAAPDADGRERVRSGEFAAYAEVHDGGIRFFGSAQNSLESSIVEGMLAAFADRVNLAGAVLMHAPDRIGAIAIGEDQGQAAGGIAIETGLDPDRKPGAMDYFGIVMTTMIALYASVSASNLMRGERVRKTALRLSAAPVSKWDIFAGKVLGCTVINATCLLLVFLFSKYAFQVYWGEHTGVALLVLLSEVILAVSLGLGCGYLFPDKGAIAVLMIFIQLASMFGGAYFPIDMAGGGWLSKVAQLSPLYWVNSGMMELIYNEEMRKALLVSGANLAIAAILLGFSAVIMRKREAI